MTRKIRHPACTLLRKLMSPYGYGAKDAFGYRRPTNKAIVNEYNTKGFIRGLNNAQLLSHFRGETTRYYWADGRVRTPRAMVCIDIDCHKTGTLAAAMNFARHLQEKLFPNLYFEPSTNGNGVHCYVILDKRGFGDHYLHHLCRLLDETVKVVHREWQAQNLDKPVEGVEIKGHPPRVNWTRDGKIAEFVSGQFAKLPREMLTRFDEFARTTVLNQFQILDLNKRFKDRPVILKKPIPEPVSARPSLTGCVVKQTDLDQWAAYLDLARKLVPEPLKTSGREVANAEDMAIFLLILEACTEKANADGSMPTDRIGENWAILYRNDDVKRPWVPKRFAVLRNHLTSLGYIQWIDQSYLPGHLSPSGEGWAARWHASDRLMEQIAEAKCLVGQSRDDLDLPLHAGEEDLDGDTPGAIVPDQPEPAWIVTMRRSICLRPRLHHDVGRLRRAA